MPYPESGASHKYQPKWLDEMKRAEGGEIPENAQNQQAGPQSDPNEPYSTYEHKIPHITDEEIAANKARGEHLKSILGHDPAEDMVSKGE